jgi:DNA-binding IclR family transcriptional regulator
MAKSYHVPAAARALRILEYLAAHPKGHSLSEVALALKIPRPSCLRLLSTLQKLDYLRVGEGGYRLSGKISQLSANFLQGIDLRSRVRPILEELFKAAGETVEFVVRDGRMGLVLDRVEAPWEEGAERIRIGILVGARIPLPLQHTGRAILAALKPEEREKLASGFDGFFRNHQIAQGATWLSKELESAATRGFSAGTALKRPEVIRVAAAVRDPLGVPYAAIGLAAPAFRVKGRIEELGQMVCRFANRLTAEKLGL